VQLSSIRSADSRNWGEIRSAFSPDASDSPQAESINAILDLLDSKNELHLVQDSDESGVTLQFSTLWHRYREASPWRHY